MAELLGKQLGNYRLISLIGRGGFAEVYLGEHVYLKTQAAIKVLKTRLTAKEREGFLTEARTIAHLQHHHIVRVLEFGVEEGMPFLVMEYAPHGTLRQRHPRGTPLILETIVPYVKDIADALQYAHEEKLIHRDIKPENMLLGSNNEILLSDFGIALVVKTRSHQDKQEVFGTIAYMAPEQLQGRAQLASDQYALGIVVYEWLSGDRPFHGSFTEIACQHLLTPPPSLLERVPTLQPVVEQVVLIALAKDPEQRFPSVQAFADALEQASVGAHFITPTANQLSSVQDSSIPRSTSDMKGYEDALPYSGGNPSVTEPSDGKLVSTEDKDERVSVWRMGKRQAVAAIIGFDIIVCVSILAGFIISNPSSSSILGILGLILFALVAFTAEFFGAVFGPWVGLFTGIGPLVGFIIISITNDDIRFSFPIEVYWPIQVGILLVGFISGFAILKKKGRYNIGHSLSFCSLGAAVGSAFAIFINYREYQHQSSAVNDVLIPTSILALGYILISLILLPILLVVYNRIASRRKPRFTTGNPASPALPQLQPLAGIQGPESRRALPVRLKTLLIVQALLIIGGGGIFYYAAILHPATSFQDIYLNATGGTPVIDDPLSIESFVSWNIASSCMFTGGALHAYGKEFVCLSPDTDFRDFAFQARMTFIKGNGGGLFFRAMFLPDGIRLEQFYYFSVLPDGYYGLTVGGFDSSLNNNKFHFLTSSYSSAINKGLGQTNLLTVIALGNDIYLYINKQYVAHVYDSTSNSGSIGVIGEVGSDEAFRHAQVWSL
jgi:serine/threonine protein kinase